MRAFLLLSLTVFAACSTEPQQEEQRPAVSQATFANSLATIPPESGVAGFFDVPEMLCLSIQDSAPASQVAQTVERAYALLERDMAFTRAVPNGPFGQITYNNDTSNFSFECFALIKQIPAVNPRDARIVILEADHMLAYNYYGPYNLLYTGYAEIGKYLREKGLKQSGPMREYYVTDPRLQPDERKRRTVIMVPVRRQR